MQFAQCVAGSVPACNDCAGKPFALDKAAEYESEATRQFVTAAYDPVDLSAAISRRTKCGVKDYAVALFERLLAFSNSRFDYLIAVFADKFEGLRSMPVKPDAVA